MMLAGLIDVIHWLEDVFERLQLRRSYGAESRSQKTRAAGSGPEVPNPAYAISARIGSAPSTPTSFWLRPP
jgi:hypothetical protein